MDIHHLLFSLLGILNEMSPYILFGFLIAGILNTFISPDRMSRHLSGHGWRPVVKAALLGIPLPLCSCGVLPAAVALHNRGASKGATTSFLIATPQTGVDSIAATYALLGLPFAILRPIGALFGALAGGLAVDRSDKTQPSPATTPSETPPGQTSFTGKITATLRYAFVDMVSSVGKWLVIGLIVAALITVFIPDSLILSLNSYPLLAMLLMVAIAIPMYICATGSIPIALSLIMKGLSPGTAFVLLMAGPAANFASVLVLKRAIGPRATTIYITSVVVTAITFGLIIDNLLPGQWFSILGQPAMAHPCHTTFNTFQTICSAILVALLIFSAIRNRRPRTVSNATSSANSKPSHINLNKKITDMTTVYNVKGMACSHCKATVEKTLLALPGVESVTVDLSTGRVTVEGSATPATVSEAIANAGFTCPIPS